MAQDTTGKILSVKTELRLATQEAQKLGVALADIGRAQKAGEFIDPAKIKELEDSFEGARDKVARLKDDIADTNEQIKVLTAGSPFEKMANGLGDVGSKLMSLDFEGAKESAGKLITLSKGLTFGDAIKGVKDLGSTFIQLGRALLANPLFLLAAVIIGLVIVIVKIMDKIGLLKVITNDVIFNKNKKPVTFTPLHI